MRLRTFPFLFATVSLAPRMHRSTQQCIEHLVKDSHLMLPPFFPFQHFTYFKINFIAKTVELTVHNKHLYIHIKKCFY